MQLISKRNAMIWLETGTARDGDRNCQGDGCSTVIFGHYSMLMNAKLYSVDMEMENCEMSRFFT